MRDSTQDYFTVIGKNLLEPITKLLEHLKSSGVRSGNEVQTSPFENGYATAIILLTIVFLESMLNHTRHIIGLIPGRQQEKVLTFFNRNFPDSGLYDKLVELFVMRDIIAHNHIWNAKIKWDEENALRLVTASLSEGYGDEKFRRAIDIHERKTKLLKINIFPTRICWSDIVIVLKTTMEVLSFLEGKDRNYVYISNEYVEFNGKPIKLLNLINDLE